MGAKKMTVIFLGLIGAIALMAWIVKKQKVQHNPDEVMVRKDVPGYCPACKHKGMATLTAYWSKEVVIRCKNCNDATSFVVDSAIYDDPNLFKPFANDDDIQDTSTGGRYTKGKR